MSKTVTRKSYTLVHDITKKYKKLLNDTFRMLASILTGENINIPVTTLIRVILVYTNF